jgi:protein-disulfide isomerase
MKLLLISRIARPITLVALVTLLSLVPVASAQDSKADLQKEITELKEGQKAIQQELEEIKQLLKQQRAAAAAPAQAPLPKTMDTAGILVKGDPNAPITIVEFTDMQCPFCGRYAENTLSKIDQEYIKTGKVRYIVKDFPLEAIHPNALRAAEATHCAAEQNRAWDMHDRLFANQQKLTREDITAYAAALGLDAAKFQACLESDRYAADIRKEIAAGQSSGVNGTPTFFLGVSDAQPDQMKPQRMLSGALDFSVFKSVLDDMAKPQAKKN